MRIRHHIGRVFDSLERAKQGMSETRKIRVGILFGGRSAEHEISILSARNVLAALDTERFEPVLIGIDKSGRWLLQDAGKLLASARDPRLVRIEEGRPGRTSRHRRAVLRRRDPAVRGTGRLDVVFPVLHGTLGEDGAVQGLLEVAGIPYVGAGVLGSAIGMDKDVMKRLLRDAGIPVTAFRTVRREHGSTGSRPGLPRFGRLGVSVVREAGECGFFSRNQQSCACGGYRASAPEGVRVRLESARRGGGQRPRDRARGTRR